MRMNSRSPSGRPIWAATLSSGCSARNASARSGWASFSTNATMISARPAATRSAKTPCAAPVAVELARAPELVVGRPAPRAGDEHEDRQAEQVDALQDVEHAELEHPQRPGGDEQPRRLARVPAGRHADRDERHDRAEQDPRDVGLEVHRRREVDAERQQADERDGEVHADRERHERRTSARGTGRRRRRGRGASSRTATVTSDRRGEEQQRGGLAREAPVGRVPVLLEPRLVGKREGAQLHRARTVPPGQAPRNAAGGSPSIAPSTRASGPARNSSRRRLNTSTSCAVPPWRW